MFKENLKTLRKKQGLSQEALASKLHVVRQTISKWEKGLSVPDAQMLLDLATILDTSVSTLLGANIEEDNQENLSTILSQINDSLIEKNQKSHHRWKLIFTIFLVILLVYLLLIFINYVPIH